MQCSKCNGLTQFKQGIKKETGKPWSGYFCQNPDCKNVDWQRNNAPKAQKGTATASDGLEAKIDYFLAKVEEMIQLMKDNLGV